MLIVTGVKQKQGSINFVQAGVIPGAGFNF